MRRYCSACGHTTLFLTLVYLPQPSVQRCCVTYHTPPIFFRCPFFLFCQHTCVADQHSPTHGFIIYWTHDTDAVSFMVSQYAERRRALSRRGELVAVALIAGSVDRSSVVSCCRRLLQYNKIYLVPAHVPFNIRTGRTYADAFRGHRQITHKGQIKT